MKNQDKITPKCKTCGGDNILFDSWACWDDGIQDYELVHTSEKAFCQDCSLSETTINWVPVVIMPKCDTVHCGCDNYWQAHTIIQEEVTLESDGTWQTKTSDKNIEYFCGQCGEPASEDNVELLEAIG